MTNDCGEKAQRTKVEKENSTWGLLDSRERGHPNPVTKSRESRQGELYKNKARPGPKECPHPNETNLDVLISLILAVRRWGRSGGWKVCSQQFS